MNGPAACKSTHRVVHGGIGLRGLEWLFLLLGLAALIVLQLPWALPTT